ncbi:MAG: hypothetical protein HOP12_13920 [Candidatus Eisenbacteria bacterium]|uniref:Uncharacterized protein n=1 Tax=Eiseniibacteriota bacterium TaxID=2212470 RepID=A0A849T1S6_UNCEI|nr:hypothetical protein [Candidatus Eisenbacteria bacterium]
MSQPTRPSGSDAPHAASGGTASGTDRVEISCPGCGRHDWVTWPHGQPGYEWKCFNCSKQFTLARKVGH